MVASVEQTAKAKSQLQTKTPKKAFPQRKHWEINPAVEAKARTMYLVRGMPPSAVAEELQVNVKAIYDLSSRRGWSKLRNKRWKEADKESQDALSSDVSRVMNDIALESEELTVGSLQLARESLVDKDAKSLSMASSAIRNLVEVARRIRGLDAQQQSGSGGSVNFFVLNGSAQAATKAEPVNVTPTTVEKLA